MGLTNTSTLLHTSMTAILDSWETKFGGREEPLYWYLRAQDADISGGDVASIFATIQDSTLREEVSTRFATGREYWADVRYASLEPITTLWGTIVNSLRVAAKTGRATDRQRAVFEYSPASVLAFFMAAWDRMEIADGLFHVFRAMPAPECQAMAALLNVHVDASLDEVVMCRLVRLLDHEGPMSEEEVQDLASLSNTHLVNATFSGARGSA